MLSRLLARRISRQAYASTRICCYHELSFIVNGEPRDVISYRHMDGVKDTNSPGTEMSQVRVDMIAAPWNPADMNTVQGKYASPYKDDTAHQHLNRSQHFRECTVVGSEGWGIVTDVALSSADGKKNPLNVQPGDWVAIGLPSLGTMRSSIWLPTNAVIPIKRGEELHAFSLNCIDGAAAVSTLFQLGGTALRMLRDFRTLEDGDIVLQNAGNSGVAFLLSQLASASGRQIHPVSMVRRGSRSQEEYDALAQHLLLVAKNAIVVAEEDLLEDKDVLRNFQSDLKRLSTRSPILGLNAVGGDSASLLLKLIGPGGTMVTYGGMSMKPVTVRTPDLIFKDVRAVGYWHSRWMVNNSESDSDRRCEMINGLVDLLLSGRIVNASTKSFQLRQVQEALAFEKTQSAAGIREKIAFDCTEHSR